MDVDSQQTMEETILVGDDLMMGPPSPLIPPEIASHVLEGVDLCDGILRNLFLCLQINDIEPFCQDEIALYRQCAERRDIELRQRLQESEKKLGTSMPIDQAKERANHLESEVTLLERNGRISTKMEFAWLPYGYQEEIGCPEAGNGEQEKGRANWGFNHQKEMVLLVKIHIHSRRKTSVLAISACLILKVVEDGNSNQIIRKRKEDFRLHFMIGICQCMDDTCFKYINFLYMGIDFIYQFFYLLLVSWFHI